MNTEITPDRRATSRRTIVAGVAWTVPAVAVAIAAPTASASGNPPVNVGVRSLQLNHFHIHEVAAHIQPGELFDSKIVLENDSASPDPGIFVPAGTTVTVVNMPPAGTYDVLSVSNPDWTVSFSDGPTPAQRTMTAVLTVPLPAHSDESEVVITFQRKATDTTPEQDFKAVATLTHPFVTLPGAHTTALTKDDKFKYEF